MNKKPLIKIGCMTFPSWQKFQDFYHQLENGRLQRLKDNPVPKDFDFAARFNRSRTSDEVAKADKEFEKVKSFYTWLSDNRDSYNGHSYRPGFDMFVDFFLEQNNRFNFDRLSVTGTYTIITGPEGELMDLPHMQIQKGEMVIDIVHDFFMYPSYLVRIDQTYEPSEMMMEFLSKEEIYPMILKHLSEIGGEQTILPVDELYDLYGVLCILLGKR